MLLTNLFFCDDVNFIKKGWINRNRIMLTGKSYGFSIPLKQQSQNVLIKDTRVADLQKFSDKFLQQLSSSYKKSPYKDSVLDYVREVLTSRHVSISEIAAASVELFFEYLGLEKLFHYSSKEFSETRGLEKAERLIKITKSLKSDDYINAIGGSSLYGKEFFASKGVKLSFVKPSLLPYEHCNVRGFNFTPGLSIIDIMMNLPEQDIRSQLDGFDLV
ncbi:WbqC family protein [bacterium]|nr:WbqC family protein [bacterium]